MNTSTAYFRSRRNRDSRPARIRILSSIVCKPLGQEARAVAAGEELVVSDATLHELSSEDAEFLARIDIAEIDGPKVYL